MDEIGIPVWQAIRPGSKNLVVSQGKGLTDVEAKVSALMESIEMFSSESPPPIDCFSTLKKITKNLGYDFKKLPGHGFQTLPEDVNLEWTKGFFLDNGAETRIPRDLINLDYTREKLSLYNLLPVSNGLAGGNSLEEAVLHGLYEVIERDSLFRQFKNQKRLLISLNNINSKELINLLEIIKQANMDLEISDITGSLGIPCALAKIISLDFWTVFMGSACSLSMEKAIYLAILEAIQSRLTNITGSRDDIDEQDYHEKPRNTLNKNTFLNKSYSKPFESKPVKNFSTLDKEIEYILDILNKTGGYRPVIINMTKKIINIPVAFTIIPGMIGPG